MSEIAVQILEGETPAPTPIIAFIVKRAQEARDSGNQLMDQRGKLQKELSSVNARIVEIRGALKQYQEDIDVLLEEPIKAPPTPPDDTPDLPNTDTMRGEDWS